MSLGKTWYTVEEAAEKYCLEKSLLLKLVENGVLRSEEADNGTVRVNVDDLALKVQEIIDI